MNIARAELKELGKLAPFSLLGRLLAGSRMRAAEGKLPGTLISAEHRAGGPSREFWIEHHCYCIGLAAAGIDEK